MPDNQGRVRYAVVGGGWISQGAFMPGVGQTENSVMTALVTGDPVKADGLAKKYGLTSYRYEEFETLLASGTIDAVYIATPNFRHREFAEPALRAGIHVLLEKPMECSVAEAQAIEEAAKASGAKLMIAYRLHCEPGTLALLQAIRDGAVGKPLFFSSDFSQNVKGSNHRAKSGYWGGPVPDMGTYPINAARNLFGAEPVSVRAVGTKGGRDLGFDDTVAVTLEFPGERLATFTVSYSGADVDEFRVIGSEGMVRCSPAFGFGEGTAITYTLTDKDGNESEHEAAVVDQFAGETAYFSECILNDREPEPNGEEGTLDVVILEAVERALESGDTQKLEPRERRRRPEADQKREFPLAKVPDFVNTDVPMG